MSGARSPRPLRSLWAIPTIYRLNLEEELPALEQKVVSTERAAMLELIEARKLSGNSAMLSRETRGALRTAFDEEDAVEARIISISRFETSSSQVAAGEAEGLAGLADSLSGVARAVPYIGSAVAAGLTIYQDRQQGESWGRAVADGAVSNGAALAAGAAAAALVGGGSVVAVGGGGLRWCGRGWRGRLRAQPVPGELAGRLAPVRRPGRHQPRHRGQFRQDPARCSAPVG